jgi:hypothetical protein
LLSQILFLLDDCTKLVVIHESIAFPDAFFFLRDCTKLVVVHESISFPDAFLDPQFIHTCMKILGVVYDLPSFSELFS